MTINCDIPQGTIEAFKRAFTEYHTKLGNSLGTAVRRGFAMLAKRLVTQTRIAPKTVPPQNVTRYRGDGPQYITPKGHKQKPMPRWTIKRRGGTDGFAYVKSAETKTAARQIFGKIKNRGLAKKSWRLVSALIAQRASPDTGAPPTKIRAGMVRGYVHEYITGDNQRVEALIENNLGYICAATPDAAVNEAMHRATNQISGFIQEKEKEARQRL